MPESSYNAPRLHVAIEARKIVISGEVAGLQIQLGPPAVPGRFNSCDLPPKCSPVRHFLIKKYAKKTIVHRRPSMVADIRAKSTPSSATLAKPRTGCRALPSFLVMNRII